MKIKEFSNKYDLSYDTIRYYMKLNLINPQKSGGHYEFAQIGDQIYSYQIHAKKAETKK